MAEPHPLSCRWRLVIYPLLFSGWVLYAIPLFRAEWFGLREAAVLRSVSTDDRKYFADGPIYILLRQAQILVAPESTVYFFNQAPDAEGKYYEGKLKYYLWPRKLAIYYPNDPLQAGDLLKADAVLLFNRTGKREKLAEILDSMPFSQAFEYNKNETYQAIYIHQK